MGLFSFASNGLRRLNRRHVFGRITTECDLRLSFEAHHEDVALLEQVFVERVYSDWFPHRRTATIVDIGAHKGFFTLFAARHAAPDSRLFAIEPSPGNLTQLRTNLAANGLSHVAVLDVAVGAEDGQTRLHLGPSENHSIFPDHTARLRRASSTVSTPVEMVTLRTVLDRCDVDHVDFLKLDCEGSEYPILLSADAATLGRIDVISLEFHDTGKPGWTGRDLAEHLERSRFRVVRFAHGATWIDNDYGRIIAVRDRH